jgi:hypothetical protein
MVDWKNDSSPQEFYTYKRLESNCGVVYNLDCSPHLLDSTVSYQLLSSIIVLHAYLISAWLLPINCWCDFKQDRYFLTSNY